MQTIDLSRLKSNRIDLSKVKGQVRLQGNWNGDRLILQKPRHLRIVVDEVVTIESTHAEDALILDHPEHVTIDASQGKFILNQSITVWGTVNVLNIKGVDIHGAHTGIRINQDNPYRSVRIEDCNISNIKHEGIYVGPHYKSVKQLQNVNILNNYITNCGWDGLQVGNCKGFNIEGNIIKACGLSNTYGQNYFLTINPGSEGKLFDNLINGNIQILDSRVFIN